MCAEKNLGDLAKLHAYFVDRVRKVPNDETTFAHLLKSTTRGNCKPNARPVAHALALDGGARAPRAPSAEASPAGGPQGQ
jgi:hypothetical protein